MKKTQRPAIVLALLVFAASGLIVSAQLQPGLQPGTLPKLLDQFDGPFTPKAGNDFGKLFPGGKWKPPDDTTMQDGVKAPKGSAPFAMSITGHSGGSTVLAHECTAIYVGNRIVVTAEHCLRGKGPGDVTVAYGALNLNEASAVTVGEVLCNSTLDVGLLVIEHDPKVQAATLVAASASVSVKAFGWGADKIDPITKKGKNSPDLLEVTMTTKSKTGACVASASRVCAESKGPAGPCQRDSGGPLVTGLGTSVAGVLTNAEACPRKPGATARATYASGDKVKAWVAEAMKLKPEQREKQYSCLP